MNPIPVERAEREGNGTFRVFHRALAQDFDGDGFAQSQAARVVSAPVDTAHRAAHRHVAGELVEFAAKRHVVCVGTGVFLRLAEILQRGSRLA